MDQALVDSKESSRKGGLMYRPIPRKIHYVWFGGKPLPAGMKALVDDWRRLMPEFEVLQWDETNIDIAAHPYLSRMHQQGQFAFASDYARLLVLHGQGGIYLDTDVRMKKSLAPFTTEECFWSFEFDHFISTAVIGSRPGHPLLKVLLDEYEHLDAPVINNVLVTEHFIREFPEFRLGNKDQLVGGDIRVFPKECMIIPSFNKKQNYAVHLANNHWKFQRKKFGMGRVVRTVLGEVLFYKLVNLKLGWESDFPAMEKARRKK